LCIFLVTETQQTAWEQAWWYTAPAAMLTIMNLSASVSACFNNEAPLANREDSRFTAASNGQHVSHS